MRKFNVTRVLSRLRSWGVVNLTAFYAESEMTAHGLDPGPIWAYRIPFFLI